MKAIVQRVLSASVTVDGRVVSSIANGLLVFAAVAPDDTPTDIDTVASRILKLKAFDALENSGGGRWKASVLDLDYQILMVSQFTLLASTRKGNKPDFHGACEPALAEGMYKMLVERVREGYAKAKELEKDSGGVKDRVQDGVFGAMMQVALVNDGPVTLEIVTAPKEKPKMQDGKAAKGKIKQRGGSPKRTSESGDAVVVENGEKS
ncbi:D-Tyr tRNAtyr deacylase-like domain-containing protein [Geopyxis carbonaria]|nr:D-Tyr tRNAtyr deacylase-like domain-containing protein [Geopyxis carbonaria]